MAALPTTKYVQLIENHGPQSGGSLPHPHSQILGLPIVPAEVETRLQRCRAHWVEHRVCLLEEMIMDARRNDRVLTEDNHCAALVPFAQRRPFEFWIIPKHPGLSFASCTPDQVAALSDIVRRALGMLYVAKQDPDYNLILRSLPEGGDWPIEGDWYRWHVEVIPHHRGST